MSVVLRNWARRPPVLSGYPPSPRRGPLVTPEMCPHFLLMSMASPQHQKGPLPPLQIRPIPRIFFPPKTVSFFTLGDLRTLLGYHSLISGSYRGPFARWLPRPLPERAFDDDATAKQTTTNEYFCINLISSRAFSGSKEGRIRSMDGSLLEQPFCIKTRSLGRRKEGRTGAWKQRSRSALLMNES